MLQTASHAQKERLAYLELHAFFVGELRRGDLEARFSIKPAAATRDLNAYRALAPDNLIYDRSGKAYVPSPSFQPIFGFRSERVLSWLLNGFGDGLASDAGRALPAAGVGSLTQPDFDVLAELTRAIHARKALQIQYLSLSSGSGNRVIVPLALANNGSRWHIRAFDRKRQRFLDFVLTRITQVTQLPEPVMPNEQLAADQQWSRMLDLQLLPHPDLAHPEAIIADYGMEEGCLHVTVRAALAGYALLRWGVDCSADHHLDSARHPLWLSSLQALDGVESARLAPGFAHFVGDEETRQ
jgi:hypothetical protein